MTIKFDESNNEYYAAFIDIDDRAKKSKFLKTLYNANINNITMSILENDTVPTSSQMGLFKAFLILLEDYTGYTHRQLKDTIFSHLEIDEDDFVNFTKRQYGAFLERMYLFCSENIGIQVEMVHNKLMIIKNDD